MCGVVGIVNLRGDRVDPGLLQQMTRALAHRGPDGEGQRIVGCVGLGHRRLSVIDLSADAAQPLLNETGDVAISYNGEIYNFRELRAELESCGHVFRSRTDSEVALHGYEEWGASCVTRFNGMFAFAIQDSRVRDGAARPRVFLARDRYGIKPLYYSKTPDAWLFASEIKAFLPHPAFRVRVCHEALSEYFTFQNIFSDATLFDGVKLLQPGCTLTIDPDAAVDPKPVRYWDYEFRTDSAISDGRDASACLRHLFERAVERQLVSDVPIGCYLSGGMDSASITSVAVRSLPRTHTFTGGFDLSSASGLELGFDERPAAEALANRYKTEHYEVVLHAGDMEHVLPELIWHQEDLRVGQCYPNYYVARLASRFVRVVLSGSGGDELFGGYPWRYYRGLESRDPSGYLDAYYDYWQRLVPDEDRRSFFNDDTWAAVSDHRPRDVFRSVFDGHPIPLDGVESVVNASLYFELKTFLHGLFVVEDKLSMAHSLETRVPFMDNDLVDFALQVPPRMKLRDLEHAPWVDEDDVVKRPRFNAQSGAEGKKILREAMQSLLPPNVTGARKQGFSAPDASWFAGESIEYVKRLVCTPSARINEFVNPAYARRIVDEHSRGLVNHRLLIWSLLSFEWWCRQFLN
jgi:asparagine synthase (glutamine-hydrolysing)